MVTPTVKLKSGRDASIHRLHHWVFSGAIQQTIGHPREGDLVAVYSSSEERLGFGHYNDSTIAVRMLQFGTSDWSEDFWNYQISASFKLRQSIGVVNKAESTAYRLVHGEGDGLPGLIIDIYGDHAVVQCHTFGMYLVKDKIAAAVRSVLGTGLRTIYDKSKESLGPQSHEIENEFLFGSDTGAIITECSHRFKVNWVTGQKTGFFLDQKPNRKIFGELCHGRTVLNLFCYSGGFSVYALANGATEVVSVDVSAKAMELTNENVALIQNPIGTHSGYCQNVNEYVRDCKDFDIIVCDPPAFAKSLNKRHQALIGYKNLNAKVIKKVKPGGFLFTFSCSQVMDRELFQQTILAAALESNRKVKILQHLSQGPDHPTNIYHPEGSYLKGLLLYIED